jgi:hypothetical protein
MQNIIIRKNTITFVEQNNLTLIKEHIVSMDYLEQLDYNRLGITSRYADYNVKCTKEQFDEIIAWLDMETPIQYISNTTMECGCSKQSMPLWMARTFNNTGEVK